MIRLFAALLLALSVTVPAVAKEAAPLAEDPVIEARLKHLAKDLRCLVCQNQTLADSEADLAKDFRREIRLMMKQGLSDEEVTAFLVDRYGDFVLYRPPMKGTTLLLWIGPAALMIGGLAALIVTLRRRRAALLAEGETVSEEELARARKLLDEDDRNA